MKVLVRLMICISILFTACTWDVYSEQNDREYESYGALNERDKISGEVCYKVSYGNAIWSVLLSWTVVAPIYFIGYDIVDAVRMKHSSTDDCLSND